MTKILLALSLFWGAGLAGLGVAVAAPPARDPAWLAILGSDYPRVFFFRAAEGPPRRGVDYETWDAEFSRLMGIMGKCLDEEVLGSEAHNPDYFSRFKQRHPRQAVLLHFNGNSRNPEHQTGAYFPGHWIYRRAVPIVEDVPGEAGEAEIRVENVGDFHVETGRYRTSADDIALFGVAPDGRHDWDHCEQVKLLAVDAQKGTIRVKRGCYGTKPLAFQAGKSRAAAHQVEGPWGKKNPLLWYYNFSTQCPKDNAGYTCADRLVADLVAWFGPGGKLEAFDGLEFDVMFHTTRGDTDGDGEIDDGLVNGVNEYGIGVIEFARKLRRSMGKDFVMQGDGALGPGGVRSQRAWGLLNGIESEGFPNLDDWDMEDWPGGLNRHGFWQANAFAPAFSYINHKWTEPIAGKPGEQTTPDVPFARHRLVFAAAQFTDSMLCYSIAPARGGDGRMGIWDELIGGADRKLGWLGKPAGEAVHLAAASPDLLRGMGKAPWGMAGKLVGNVAVRTGAEGLVVSARDAEAGPVEFALPDVPVEGRNLVVRVNARAMPLRGYPPEMARLVQVTARGGVRGLLEPVPQQTGMAFRGQPEGPILRESRAQVGYRPALSIGGVTLPAYGIHPPYVGGKGLVFWCRDVPLPAQAELRFSLGMGEKSPERSDGVWFQVWVAELLSNGKPGPFQRVFEQSTQAHAWLPCAVSLAPWSGKAVRLKFVADCGPRDNATTDQGYWGNVRVVRGDGHGAEPVSTPPRTVMSWVNGRSFTSFFSFRDIRSGSIDLDFQFEGAEPVIVEEITAYAHADTMFRVFERGLVLANPSRESQTFDLEALSPGARYRRLLGTAGQDLQCNDGSGVAGKITLGERDALFLVRVPEAAK